MAAGTLPAPGTKLGPCIDPCTHADCACTRAMAAATCDPCREPIGYETRFYQVGRSPARDTQGDPVSWAHTLEHALCREQAINDAAVIAAALDNETLARCVMKPDPLAAVAAALDRVSGERAAKARQVAARLRDGNHG